MEGFLFAHDPS